MLKVNLYMGADRQPIDYGTFKNESDFIDCIQKMDIIKLKGRLMANGGQLLGYDVQGNSFKFEVTNY